MVLDPALAVSCPLSIEDRLIAMLNFSSSLITALLKGRYRWLKSLVTSQSEELSVLQWCSAKCRYVEPMFTLCLDV